MACCGKCDFYQEETRTEFANGHIKGTGLCLYLYENKTYYDSICEEFDDDDKN